MAPRLSTITLSMLWLAAGGVAVAVAENARGTGDRPTWDSDGQGTSVVNGQRGSSPGHKCTTPEPWRQPGHCVILNSCRPLLDLLRAARFNPRGRPDGNVTDLLRRSHCGFEGGVPRVCCADDAPTAPPPERVRPLGGGFSGGAEGYQQSSAKVPPPQVPEFTALPLDYVPQAGVSANSPFGEDHHSASRESAANTPREPPRSQHREPQMPYSPHREPAHNAHGEPAYSPANEAAFSSPTDAGYPTENLALLPTEVCGMRFHPQPSQQVGNRTGLMQYPWMARLGYRRSEHGDSDHLEYLCTGSIVSERYVLTAAHCVTTHNGPVSVRLGEVDAHVDPDCEDSVCAPGVVDIAVEDKLVHEDYQRGLNDIALLRLARPVAFSEAVNPVCLPIPIQGREEEELAGRTMTVAGWGNTSPIRRQHAPSRWLLHHRNQVVGPDRCQSLYDSLDDVHFDAGMHLCVGGSCQADSGSPLMLTEDAPTQAPTSPTGQRAVLYGLLSYGQPDCALRAAPLVFTKVSRYVPWVLRNLKPNPFVPKEPVSSNTRLVDPRLDRGRGHQ